MQLSDLQYRCLRWPDNYLIIISCKLRVTFPKIADFQFHPYLHTAWNCDISELSRVSSTAWHYSLLLPNNFFFSIYFLNRSLLLPQLNRYITPAHAASRSRTLGSEQRKAPFAAPSCPPPPSSSSHRTGKQEGSGKNNKSPGKNHSWEPTNTDAQTHGHSSEAPAPWSVIIYISFQTGSLFSEIFD